jgi:Na+-translocating ferredoxin:NAD+ oxidoreductase RnfD subunit
MASRVVWSLAEHVDLAQAEPELMKNVTATWQAAQAKVCYHTFIMKIIQQSGMRKFLQRPWVLLALLWMCVVPPQAPYFQTNDVPGFANCTSVAAFVEAHQGFGGPICYNGSVPF